MRHGKWVCLYCACTSINTDIFRDIGRMSCIEPKRSGGEMGMSENDRQINDIGRMSCIEPERSEGEMGMSGKWQIN